MERYPRAISKNKTKKILEQMKKLNYKIINGKGKFSSGFFCYIKNEIKNIPVLIIDKDTLSSKNQKGINILMDKMNKNIEFGDIIYTDKAYNIAIIEIKEKNIKDINFFEIDDKLYEKDYEINYYLETIYLIHYNNIEKNVSVSYGTINHISNYEIKYSCNLDDNSKFSPIFNSSNNKIIGIHEFNSVYYNKGIFLGNIIKDFLNYYKIKKKINNKIYNKIYNKKTNNIIKININVTNFREQERIYFLDNYNYKDSEGKYHYHDNLKELNDNNTELYINGKKYIYKKYFIPKKNRTYDITLKFNINLKDCSYMFAGCNNIKNINFINFDTSNSNTMEYMFADCTKLEKLNLSSFNTKNVVNMRNMFFNCGNLTNLDLSSFDTKNVINMSHIFDGCKKLENIDLLFFVTNKVLNMSNMFNNCLLLKNLNLSSFNTKNVIDMSYMFYNCCNLIKLDLSSFDTYESYF